MVFERGRKRLFVESWQGLVQQEPEVLGKNLMVHVRNWDWQ